MPVGNLVPPPQGRVLGPAQVLLGPGNPVALQNINGQTLPDGAMCWVIDQQAWYTFQKFSTASPSGTLTVATVQGTSVAGRWVRQTTGGATGPTGPTGATGSAVLRAGTATDNGDGHEHGVGEQFHGFPGRHEKRERI